MLGPTRIFQLGFLLLCTLALCVACSNNSASPSPATPSTAQNAATSAAPTAASRAEPTAARSTTPAAGQLGSLSLVYVDRSKGGGQADVYTASADGSNPKRIGTLAQGQDPIDVRGKMLAALDTKGVAFIDLTGATAPILVPVPASAAGQLPFGGPGDGRFLDDSTFVFTAGTGCGNGALGSGLFKVDMKALSTPATAVTKLASLTNSNLTIAGVDPASGVVAVSPRGCDVAFHSIDLYNVADGKLLSSTPTDGCGWAVAAPARKKALLGWRSCNQPGSAHAGIDFTVYDLTGSQSAGHNLKSPNGNTITQAGVLRPGQPQAAIATSNPAPGPGAAAGTGIWLLNLTDLSFKALAPGAGSEQAPIGWSPDGRDLLVEIVQAQGVCGYAYIDVPAAKMQPINKDITFCGTNGDVVGWTKLP